LNFVIYKKQYLDIRGNRQGSKAQIVMNFLKDNSDKAFCSSDIAKNLQSNGVHPRDIMGTVRKNEKTVYVRGYRTNQGQTPFKEGFLLTWIHQSKPREQAIEEAINKTDEERKTANRYPDTIESWLLGTPEQLVEEEMPPHQSSFSFGFIELVESSMASLP
jgi:hypothetical protein